MHTPDFSSPKVLEKYSCAFTLGDMELFIFPDLLFSLVLANIMSPRLWQWKKDPWFEGIEKLTPYRRILRVKQYIMDHYDFNLDLDTWGLTNKITEINRFKEFIDIEIVKQSNALFGYEGDKYYFSVDIRKHFGLDKYTSDTIPYWKTETIEAMDAFKFKPGFAIGAGECVSLSTLYIAALFVLGQIPLEDMFLIGTPLHSQGFVLIGDGVITNNRRIVTKQMWFNGTEVSRKARRAIENEKVVIVSHISGNIHSAHLEASINPTAYERFNKTLREYLTTQLTPEIFANFLRDYSKSQLCFQIRYSYHGRNLYIESEKVYSYEHSSPYKVSDITRSKLLAMIEVDEFYPDPIPNRIVLNDMEDYIESKQKNICDPQVQEELQAKFLGDCADKRGAFQALVRFVKIAPHLPDTHKTVVFYPPISITPSMTREEIQAHIYTHRATNPTADLAFYAYRDMETIDWRPFCKAALERNPNCIQGFKEKALEQVVSHLETLPNESIYDGNRFAQPDEVWNYQRGDGWEKAFVLATIIKNRTPQVIISIAGNKDGVILTTEGKQYTFTTTKTLEKSIMMTALPSGIVLRDEQGTTPNRVPFGEGEKGGGFTRFPYNPKLTKFAKENRKKMTPAERKMWYELLSDKKLIGTRWLKQRPIDNFIADFYCPELKLVVEVDGDGHAMTIEKDFERTSVLNGYGIHVVRFSNKDVLENLEGVTEQLLEIIEKKRKEKNI